MKPVGNPQDYLLNIQDGEVWLLKSRGEVKITPKRALEWVEAGIKSFECRTAEEMKELLEGML